MTISGLSVFMDTALQSFTSSGVKDLPEGIASFSIPPALSCPFTTKNLMMKHPASPLFVERLKRRNRARASEHKSIHIHCFTSVNNPIHVVKIANCTPATVISVFLRF